jgi:uncharacterized membrane protein YeaQ/YmgE (transglycosylase-associated protein family)
MIVAQRCDVINTAGSSLETSVVLGLDYTSPTVTGARRKKVTMDIVWFLLIGVAAGWLASQIMKGGGSGLVTDLIMGVIGAILGGFLFGLLGLSATGAIGSLVTATVGAIVLIAGLRLINRQRL